MRQPQPISPVCYDEMIMGQPRSTSVLTPYHKSVFPPRGPHGIPNQSLSHSAGPFTDVVMLMEDLMPFFSGALCSEPWLLVLLLGLFPGLS